MRLNTRSIMEGRKCIIYLPNERRLDYNVHNKQLGKDLWETVVSELQLKEEHYFGLKFKTSGEHYAWIQDDKKVLDHDIDMKSTDFPLEFIFCVKCYEDSVTVHKHASTVELLFLHAQDLLYKGDINATSDLSLELGALSLQAFYGNFTSEEKAFSDLKKLSCLPRSVIQQFPSFEYCEEQVISWYKNLCGISRGQAILLYMSKVEKLSNYGVHFFKVKDKARIQWWLGICNKGIYQYHIDNKETPNQVFQWRNLENLYFREKKFSVEVCSSHRRALSTGSTAAADKTKKAGNTNQPPKTHTWYGSPALIKSIWIMAIAQHQFYWDRKQSSKSKSHTNKTNASNLRNALDQNSNSLVVPPSDDHNTMQRKNNRKNVQAAVPVKKGTSKVNSVPQSPAVKALEEKMITDLKKRKLALEDQLYDKVQELKEICKEEYNITEKLPIEYLRYLIPGEEKPVLKKKIGASFPVQLRPHPNRVYKSHPAAAEELQRLESECELLNQITKAAYKLAYDPSSKGRMKKKRLQSYQKSLKKLQVLENRIDELRKNQGRDAAFRQSTLIMTSDFDIINAMKECSIDDKSERSSLSDGIMLEDETSVSSGAEALSTHSTPALSLRPNSNSADVDMQDIQIQRSRTPPPTKSKVAWLESPRGKNKKKESPSPNSLYPVMASPTSYRSTTSHSSGTDTPPHQLHKRDWGPKWDQPRYNEAWKVSSLDSLESIGSRRSNEQSNGSPTKRKVANGEVPNANAMRIARAAETAARAHKVSLREKHRQLEPSRRMGTVNPVVEIVQDTVPEHSKDSRTSLTDSGHGTDSRGQSCHEDEILRRQRNANAIRRDISDSSLSELSTQSNPAALPSSGHIQKFVPYFMRERNRGTAQQAQAAAADATLKQNEQNHNRKRSSSFTESGSTLQKPVSRRDNHRTLTRSNTQNENENVATVFDKVDPIQPNGEIPTQNTTSKSEIGLTTSQSANNLPPPMFDTNLNICKQYLSRSQGQLTQNNPTIPSPPNEDAPPVPYVSVIDKQPWSGVKAANHVSVQGPVYHVSVNNNNNKLNFGQIYKLSKGQVTHDPNRLPYQHERSQIPQDGTVLRNIPKCNSLDSVLDRGHSSLDPDINPDAVKNYALEQQLPLQTHPTVTQYPMLHSANKSDVHRAATPQVGNPDKDMTISDRDKYNNAAFDEIRGMDWVPSLDDYGSRASVAESLPAKSKREDIRELLQMHIAQHWKPSRTPSTSSTSTMRMKKERQLQAKIRAEMMKEKESQNHPESSLKSGSNVNTWEDYKQNLTSKRTQNPGPYKQPTKSEHTGVNIFAHKPPPPLPKLTQRNYTKAPDPAPGYSQAAVHKGYINPNGYIVPVAISASDEQRKKPTANYVMSQSNQQTGKNMQKTQQEQSYYYQTALQAQQQSEKPDAVDTKESPDAISGLDGGAMVIQATRTSPNGHKVSVFTVTKSAPNTPLPPKKENMNDEMGNKFFGTDEILTSTNDQLSPDFSECSEQSNTDTLQAIAIEAAKAAQKNLNSSRGNLDKFKPPPALPLFPPNSNLRSSTRGRRVTTDLSHASTPVKRNVRTPEPGISRVEAATPEKRYGPETRTMRSRSKSRKDRETNVGRAASPATPPITTSTNGVIIPVKDLRSGAKTPKLTQRSPSPTPIVPNFQRTLSTPIRTKPVALKPNGSPKNSTKITGMYSEPMTGVSARSRPPAAPRVTLTAPTPTRTRGNTAPPEPNLQSTPRRTYQIGQSGTLPRTPRSNKKIERSGSITSSYYQANRTPRPTSTQPSNHSGSSYGRSYIPTPRKELYNALLGDEDLKYKRSLSETWKHQNLVPVPVNMQPQHHPQMYHHRGHHRMPATNADTRTIHDYPRRTASADDLLCPQPDGRDPNANINIRSQRGTLV